MNSLNFSKIIKISMLAGALVAMPIVANAANDSSKIHRVNGAPMQLVSKVDTHSNKCQRYSSGQFYIIAGNSIINKNMKCPADKPVMTDWVTHTKYFGALSVSSGGTDSSIYCCPVQHKWEKV